ncbi:MAG: ATP-binding cassette, subfamily bacterial HlyB/CyaB [Actinomycetota bacterium]|nr:ATP-binding cassette, subfamily bacterial HlyB/CyaB [Actinomycetota bacterium]
MSLSETIDPADIPLFRYMPDDVRDLVVASLDQVSYRFGSVVVRDGDPSDALYVIVSGRARVVKVGDNGEEVTLDTLERGETFGAPGLLSGQPRSATVRASTQLEVLRLHEAVFRGLIARNHEIREYLELDMRLRYLRAFFRIHTPFARLPQEAMGSLLLAVERVSFGPGEVVIQEGDPPGALYVVEEGRLQAFATRDGGRQDLAHYGPGDVFGERSLLLGLPRGATVEAITDTRLLALPMSAFQSLLDTVPEFRSQLQESVAQYDFQNQAHLALDLSTELLPADADAQAVPPVGVGQVDRDLAAAEAQSPADGPAPAEKQAPFATADGRFVKRPGRIRRLPLLWQIDEADCGAACLAMVCRSFGRRVSLAAVRKAVATSIEGTSLRGIARGASELGLAARTVKASKRNVAELPLPAIVHWEGDHWVVLYDVSSSHVRIADPALGLRRLPRATFDEHWTGYAALVEPTEEFAQAPEAVGAREWLWPVFRPYRKTALTAVALALGVSALQMALPVSIQVVVDRVLPRRDIGLLHLLLLSMGGLIVAMSGGALAQRYLLSRAAVKIDGVTLDLLTGKLLALPLRYFYARRTGDIQRRLMGMRQIREFTVQNGVVGLTAAAQLIAAIVLMVVYSRVLALVFLAFLPVYVLMMRVASRRLRPLFDSLEDAFGKYASRQVDAIKGIETVKALGAEDAVRKELVDEFDALARRLFKADFTGMVYDAAVQIVGFAAFAAFLWVGANQVLAGDLSVGGLVSFNALVVLANGPILELLFLWDGLQMNGVLVNRLNDVFEEEPEQGRDRSALLPVPSLVGRVRLDNVGFQYGGADSPMIVEGISVDIPRGTTVAIVGRSGSGKTTLAKLLAGLLEPTHGRILYDGSVLSTLDYRQLRQKIGFVLQENYLFSDTIARNIALGEEPDDERVVAAARAANAHEFVARLPFGYETKVGETGLLLSGGQRQRIAIARAIYRQPPVLILDEATSSLDTESEKAVKDNLDRVLENRTTFIIAHRLSTVRNADLILVLEHGQLVEQGTHDELMARRGLYFYLSSQQLDL